MAHPYSDSVHKRRNSGVPSSPTGGPVPADVDQNAAATKFNRALYGGFGNALATAFELAAVPVLFALAGLWLDSRFGTRPVCMLVLTLFAIVGLGVRSYYQYKAKMELEEAQRPTWKR